MISAPIEYKKLSKRDKEKGRARLTVVPFNRELFANQGARINKM